MLDEFKQDASERMQKSLDALASAFNKIRTGRAHPSILEGLRVDYYGSETPLTQMANVTVEDSRTLSITPWEKNLVPEIEKAIMKSDLGLNPSTAGAVIRVPMPPLTEETRKGFIKQARHEAESARVSLRSIRRDVLGDIKDLLKEKEISEDEERRAQDEIQKLTDQFVAKVEAALKAKEVDLLEI
ncbi:MAG: ribosome recycling factor [Gammaproteobacteria bacterium]|nr:ribosome recycling factor [Gammaproteobacteria bacterium]NND39465.1 ribosome recycling factor [Pseudomonadales bacterium]MBT8150551.1 ribosome recycling factor [Gammaproteobacteria bacterium]NNL10440.1 ribosome recycling factor [Pseudomonadales bacterium]NNM11919.1 ribosome recycling factor [Pseudomonadales bacterium]